MITDPQFDDLTTVYDVEDASADHQIDDIGPLYSVQDV